MQFRLTHLLLVMTGLAGILSIRHPEIFRQMLMVFATIVLSWIFSTLLVSRQAKWIWLSGAATGILVSSLCVGLTIFTWPLFIGLDILGEPLVPFGFYLREVGVFLLACPIIGVAVGGWVIAESTSSLTKRFLIPVRFSKILLMASLLFRLLSLDGEMRPDWKTLSLFCGLVFIIHSLNWLPRLSRASRALDDSELQESPQSLPSKPLG